MRLFDNLYSCPQSGVGTNLVVILLMGFILSSYGGTQTETKGKFVYRYNPLGGELRFLPNSPPYWDEADLLQKQQVKSMELFCDLNIDVIIYNNKF